MTECSVLHEEPKGDVMLTDSEYLSTSEARELLRVKRDKMTRMIREGIIKTYESPLDRRYKMILRADVEALLAAPRPSKRVAA
jgi:excisionase family DNA binding protein